MKNKLYLVVFIVVCMMFANIAEAGSIPLNTGYDYSNTLIYPVGAQEDYWIRVGSSSTSLPLPGDSWAIAKWSGWSLPMNGPTGIASQWINAFGNTWASIPGTSPQNPNYAIYRKCFCLPLGYQKATIRGSVFSDDAIQIWLNTMTNQVLPPSPMNFTGTPYSLNYANQNAFRKGKNCIFVLVEDMGTATGFNLAANLDVVGGFPIIATGPRMSFAPCACEPGPGATMQKSSDLEDEKVLKEIVKMAEAKRIENIRLNNPKN